MKLLEGPIGDESGTTVDEIEATGDEIEATVADSPEEWPGYPVTFAIDKDPQTVFHTQDYGGWAVFEIRLSRVEQVRLLNRDKFRKFPLLRVPVSNWESPIYWLQRTNVFI